MIDIGGCVSAMRLCLGLLLLSPCVVQGLANFSFGPVTTSPTDYGFEVEGAVDMSWFNRSALNTTNTEHVVRCWVVPFDLQQLQTVVTLFVAVSTEEFWGNRYSLGQIFETNQTLTNSSIFRFPITGLHSKDLHAVKCAVKYILPHEPNATGLPTVIENRPTLAILPLVYATYFPETNCSKMVEIQLNRQLWALNSKKPYPWAQLDAASGKRGGRDVGDLSKCRYGVPNSTYCISYIPSISWTGYCVADVCDIDTIATSVAHAGASRVVREGSQQLFLYQLNADKGLYDQAIADYLNVSTADVDVAVELLTGAAIGATISQLITDYTVEATSALSSWKCGYHEQDVNPIVWVWATPLIIIVIICVVATALDYYVLEPKLSTDRPAEDLHVSLMDRTEPRLSSSERLAQMWSLRQNWNKLVDVRVGDLQFFDGIRFFAATWVILGHTDFFVFTSTLSFGNSEDVFPNTRHDGDVQEWWFSLITGGFFAVDTFFWLGGFLTAYVTLKKATPLGVSKFSFTIPILYANRYFRLLPCLLVVLGAYWIVLPTIGSGPLWPYPDDLNHGCSKYWWTEVLFLTSWKSEWLSCVGVTWYLTCDFFYFAISPFLLLAFMQDKRLGLGLIVACISASIAHYVYLSHEYKLQAFVFLAQGKGMQKTYFAPLCRAGPYLVGLLLGILYFHARPTNKSRHVLPTWASVAAQLVGGALLLTMIFLPSNQVKDIDCFPSPLCQPDNPWSQSLNDFYNGFSRTLFAVGLSLFAFAWIWGGPSLTKWFLTRPIMSPLAKLSFNAYLWHVFILTWFYGIQADALYYTRLTMLVYWLGFVYIAFALALLTHLFVEAPFCNMQSVVVKSLMSPRSSNSPTPRAVAVPVSTEQ